MDIEKLLQELKQNLAQLLGEKFQEFKPQFEKDIAQFLSTSREKLERWSLLLASGSLTADEFSWLMKSQQDLLALKTLQNAGLSKIRLNNIKRSIIDTVIKTVLRQL
ncbi:hypothetical protein GV828_11035 [Flavobacterium sp. NST-5]|uniref:Uncharacterized protein n=1 Tax=Flavobacterium ichthyis TaxID=2698827 RepID=A0ABW9ZDB8_9FLAO|nr:hypothetical protein [Flavobacterium ichthyis]NBL65734.1 hypothetical protein [Flavobacterium ichthyis]